MEESGPKALSVSLRGWGKGENRKAGIGEEVEGKRGARGLAGIRNRSKRFGDKIVKREKEQNGIYFNGG